MDAERYDMKLADNTLSMVSVRNGDWVYARDAEDEIKELADQVKEKDKEIEIKDDLIASLRQRIDELEATQ
jgi:predicted small metal-binding protein